MIANQVLSASQLANDTQIQLELAHTAGNETVVGSFALGSNGDFGASTTFSPSTAAHVFDDQTFTRAQIMSFSNDGVIITGAAEEGQTLTAETVTNDPNATINYQWEESTNSSFSSGSVTDIGTDSATYVVQQSDENDYIRVVATTSDPSNPQPAATATSAATGPIIDDAALSVSTSVVSGAAVQIGQTLVSSATITGDSSDLTAPITYQWQVSNNGGTTWSDVPATTTGQFSGQLSSFYQISQADLGDLVRVQATFTDDTGQIVTAASTPTVAVAEIAPILTVPFSYAVDEFTVSDGLGESFADTFNNGPPPIGGLFGSTPLAFQTSSGGSSGGGSTWSEVGGQAIMSSSGAAYNGTDDSVQAILLTSNLPEGSGTGESNSGLKENDTFTVSGTFDLVVPQPSTSYGIELNEALPAPGTTTQQVQIQVFGTANGGAQVHLGERDPATGVFTLLTSYTLTAAQLSGNNQIELDLVHDTANSTAISGSFELIDNSTSTFGYTFSQTGELFADSTAARALIQGISTDGVLITGTAQQGQTLTAETSTNDPNATISFQWQESNDGGQNWTAIAGATHSTYTPQATDVGDTIEVVATASDPLSQQSVTATSAPTGAVTALAQGDEWLNTSGGTWTDSTDAATNWSDGALPRSIDNVLIDLAGSGPYTVTIPNGATADAGSLTLNNANATLDVAGTLTIADALTIDAGRLVVEAGNDITVGTTVTNAGTLELATSAELPSITNTDGTIQVDAGDTLTLQGGTITGGTIDLAAGTEAAPSVTEISVPGFDSVAPAVSDNGQYTAFLIATNLPENTNNINIVGVELYDSANDQLTNISALVSSQLPNDLHPGENFSSIPSISADGQYVLFEGQYQVDNFNNGNGPTVQPYSNSLADIFLYNTQSQTVSLVYSAAATEGNPEISGNGQFIASVITVQNSQDQSYQDNVVVMNDTGSVLTQIAGDPNYNQNGNSFGDPGAAEDPGISNNGQFVSFWSTASEIAVTQNGVTTDFSTGNTAETVAEVYVYDRQNNTLQEVSVSDTGVPGNANSGGLSLQGNGSDWPTAISANGTYVVFQSSATNLVPGSGAGDQNSVSSVFNVSASNVYLYDTQTNTIQLISAGLNGAAANGASYSPQISADGDYVIFESTASNLVAGGSGGQAQTYIYDTQTGTIELVSAAADGLPADGESDYLSAISADGSVVAFGSSADNIVPTDTDGTANIFVADLNQTTSSPTPSGAIDVTADAAISDATLDGGTVTVASGVTLTLDNTTVSTTTIALNGTLDFTGPGTLDNVSLTGGKITVASGQLVTLDDVTLDNTTLTVDGGTTPSIKIDAGQWLVWAGTVTFGGPDAVIIDDNGHILHAGTLDVTFPMQTFEGSGTDTFNGNMGSGSDTIVNDGITFDGYGGFGGSITLINNTAGTIDADVSTAPFILDTSQTITNAGTLEATNGATLLIENGSIANTGTIEAAAESQVDLSDETISGGTLTGNGVFEITGSSTIGGNAVLSDGLVEIESGQTVTFGDATISGSAIEAVTVYSFTTVIDPSAGATGDYNFDSQNIAINNAGEIIGNYGDANGNYYGFVYSISSGTYTTVSDPLAVQGGSSGNGGTTVTGINDSGEVVGYYNSGSGDSAFVESGGEYTTLSQGAYALGINNSGEIVGVNYVGNNDSEGFLYSNGIYTNLNDGLAGVGGTYSFAINNSGQVLGDYYDANDDVHGFIYNSNGTYTDITDPLAAESASGAGVSGTHAEAFNNAGQVVGYYVDASGGVHGFIYSAGGYTTLNDPSAVNGTVAVGINDTGKVVGYYFDANGNTQVFTYSGGVYTDVNDPSSEGNGGLQALAINDAGQIVGTYDNGMLQGFLANPGQLAGALDITEQHYVFGYFAERRNDDRCERRDADA